MAAWEGAVSRRADHGLDLRAQFDRPGSRHGVLQAHLNGGTRAQENRKQLERPACALRMQETDAGAEGHDVAALRQDLRGTVPAQVGIGAHQRQLLEPQVFDARPVELHDLTDAAALAVRCPIPVLDLDAFVVGVSVRKELQAGRKVEIDDVRADPRRPGFHHGVGVGPPVRRVSDRIFPGPDDAVPAAHQGAGGKWRYQVHGAAGEWHGIAVISMVAMISMVAVVAVVSMKEAEEAFH